MNAKSRSSSPELDPVAVSEALAPLPELKAAGNTNIDFDGLLKESIRLREDVRNGCGGQTWPAGMVLGKHLLRYRQEELQQSKILEVGAGGGLVGLAVALACKPVNRMLMTDQQSMLELMQHNIKLNNIQDYAKAMVLNWGEDLPEEVIEQKPNVIIAAECVYYEPAFPLLIQTLEDLIQLNPDAVSYFCFKKRRRADMNFVKKAKKKFLVEEIFDADRPVFTRESLFLFTFRRKGSKPTVNAKANSHVNHKTNGYTNGNGHINDINGHESTNGPTNGHINGNGHINNAHGFTTVNVTNGTTNGTH